MDVREIVDLVKVPRDGSQQFSTILSQEQHGIWFLEKLAEAEYHIGISIRLVGTLDRGALAKALDALIERHESLRTGFSSVGGEPLQSVHPPWKLCIREVSLIGMPEADRNVEVRILQSRETRAPFDLGSGHLVRATLMDLNRNECLLLLIIHHIVCDGWSVGVLFCELRELYAAFRNSQPDPLSPLSIQYVDYVDWQRRRLKKQIVSKQLGYWRAQLQGVASDLTLPADKVPQPTARYRAETVQFDLDERLTEGVKRLAQRRRMTPFMVLIGAWSILLARLCNQEEIVIGTPVTNRRRPELEKVVGLFVNTLALRFRVIPNLSVDEFLEQVKTVILGAFDHRDIPFGRLVQELRPTRAYRRNPLFNVMCVLQEPPKRVEASSDLEMTLGESGDETAKFDLLLSIEPRGKQLVLSMNYTADLYEEETIRRWLRSLDTLLLDMTEHVRPCIDELHSVPQAERRLMLGQFNSTTRLYPKNRLIHEIFEHQAQMTPDAIAVIHDEISLTYSGLNRRANRLARYLQGRGGRQGQCIVVMLARGVEMLVAQLAILKLGAAYVPLDPETPGRRATFLVQDCGAALVIGLRKDVQADGDSGTKWVEVDQISTQASQLLDTNLPKVAGRPESLTAYVMYTSGSTGVPKGVAVPHRAIARLVLNNGYAEVSPTDIVAHDSNPAFDASTFEIWAPLLNGARVVVASRATVFDVRQFSEWLQREQITVLWLTTGLLTQYADGLAETFGQLRYLITGGEVIDPRIAQQITRRPPAQFINAYGPTECTTFTTTYAVGADVCTRRSIPIGRPIGNARIYILDSSLRPVSLGVTGEIYIGGDGVALGYLNRPDLTAERFRADPFAGEPGAVLYKSGDLGKWLTDGAIEFVGRNDHQVKIRGLRIELGEIETQLTRHPQVGQVVVIAFEYAPGDKRLVAYVQDVSPAQTAITSDSLRAHLRSVLPEYMVPSAFVVMSTLPLNVNGKIDRTKLPRVEPDSQSIKDYAPPRNEVEQCVGEIWRELLLTGPVSRDGNFFDLGGHSLLVLKMLERINQKFGSTLLASDAYKSPTLEGLAARIQGAKPEEKYIDLNKEAVLPRDIVSLAGRPRDPSQGILLTGATGFVGRFLLAQLLESSNAKIYCLVRSKTPELARARLMETMDKWSLVTPDAMQRVVCIPGDMGRPNLGIDVMSYNDLCTRIDSVYHCATSMNHLETYAMARAENVEGTGELLRLATFGGAPKSVHYISTLSVFSSLGIMENRVVTERTSTEGERHPSSSGYAASKWIGEQLILSARNRGVPCNIFRLGLVWADARTGRYDERQREYMLFKTCVLSGFGITHYKYRMTPTPVDYVARAIVCLTNRHSDGGGVFHISSPEGGVNDVFERSNRSGAACLELLSPPEWLARIRRLHGDGYTLPVAPLLESMFLDEKSSSQDVCETGMANSISFDLSLSHRELEAAGVPTVGFDDDMLLKMLNDMSSRDLDIRKRLLELEPGSLRQAI